MEIAQQKRSRAAQEERVEKSREETHRTSNLLREAWKKKLKPEHAEEPIADCTDSRGVTHTDSAGDGELWPCSEATDDFSERSAAMANIQSLGPLIVDLCLRSIS